MTSLQLVQTLRILLTAQLFDSEPSTRYLYALDATYRLSLRDKRACMLRTELNSTHARQALAGSMKYIHKGDGSRTALCTAVVSHAAELAVSLLARSQSSSALC